MVFGRLIQLVQIFADAITVLACYWGAFFVFTETLARQSPLNLREYVWFTAAVTTLYVFILDRVGLYKREISLLNIKELRGIFHVGLYSAAVILGVSFYIRTVSLSRLTMTMAIVITPVALYLQRLIFYRFHILFHQRGYSMKRVLIYGAGQIGVHLAKRMFESPSLGYLPVGFLDDDVSKTNQVLKWTGVCPKDGLKVVGTGTYEVLRLAKGAGVTSVFVALPSASFEKNQSVVQSCIENGLEYAIVPHAYEKFVQNIEIFEIGGIPIIRRRSRRASWAYLVAKRVLDFVIALIAMIILSPLIILFGILIKLDSKGPVLFKQKRVGLRGREFSFYKFRTMRVDAPKYAETPKNAADPRITKIGRWLRRTSLDELPQLYNVVRGDMSIVGPRPEMPFIVASYTPLERVRLEAKPGITGVWQISAVRGEPIHANIEYDLFYIQNRSLLLDFAVIIKTVLSVIRGIGAV